MKQRNKKSKKILIGVIAAVLVLAIGAGCFLFLGRSSEPVNVYPFMYFGMTEYWGDSMESYGPVTTDRIQTVHLSTTQTVTEVLVSLGDTVKKGDLLMTFDTTLSDIALERERLEVEKLKLQLDEAYDYLAEIKAMKPMAAPSVTPSDPGEEENNGVALTEPYRISVQSRYDGSSKDTALICWLHSSTPINEALFAAIHLKAEEYRAANSTEPPAPTDPAQPEVPSEPSEAAGSTESEETDPTEESTEPTEPAPPSDPTEPTQPEAPAADPNHYYVVLKITQGNMSLGQTTTWQGLSVTRGADGSHSFQFYDASAFSDHTLPAPEPPDTNVPDVDFGSGLTASQIAEMRSQQEKVIRDLQFQVKMAEANYKIKQTEVADGNVYAQIDGTVVSLLDPEEAQMTQQPMMKVSGGGGFYVTGSVSELDKDKLLPGQEVTVNDWNTGMTYTGTVQSIADYPAADGYFSGVGNPNTTYYPFTVFIDGSADLQSGSYVSVMYAASTAQTGVYLENPFLRTEQGRTYVYVRGADGLLEKRYVTTGKSLWGSYTQILDGLTAEDYLAFPYGKQVKDGAQTVEAEPQSLYES